MPAPARKEGFTPKKVWQVWHRLAQARFRDPCENRIDVMRKATHRCVLGGGRGVLRMEQVPYGRSRMVAVNDRGDRLGEDHPRAKLTNADIDLIRELADPQDAAKPLSYREIAEKFEVSKGTISDIVSCRRRACIPSGYRRVALAVRTPHTQLTIILGSEGMGG